ncbi:magnesium-transporting ATPase [Tetragenococcus halophilus subsp. flandriensis]|uniref:cation-translocating P-type ATPase n=1 Tax=Tetragenococcus halophilus TaxID=51669 RepID=UPI0023EA3A8B|nr:cation-translocating P-type ATPase [Tetragenococcus halophilus]GMA08152.1 magnesium-transporting ATPase [Tetragenococcus halophilus subsp. flandriensis]
MASQKQIKQLQEQYTTNTKEGLTSSQVASNREKYGKNKLPEKKQKTFFDYLKASLKDITIIILLLATTVSTYLAYHSGDTYIEPIIIFSVVVLNIILSIRQNYQADKSMNELNNFSVPSAKVIRENEYQNIPSEEIVVGDLLVIERGDRISADAILIDASNLQMEESILTGESLASEKDKQYQPNESDTLSDRKDKVFSGTLVTNGTGLGIVSEVGVDTEMGKISEMLGAEAVTKAPLEIRMQKLGRNLGILAITAALVAILIGKFQGYPMDETIMISLSMAVAAVPEVLPVVVTISLSYGMRNMAKHNTLVSNPAAVETIGNTTVITSDKTGTLTQNKMILKEIWTPELGRESDLTQLSDSAKNVLKYLYLSSSQNHSESGNPTELAIVHATETSLNENDMNTFHHYEKIYEIPFSSARKRMTIIYKINDYYLTITKGAIDVINYADSQKDKIAKAKSIHDELAAEAYRILSVGYKITTDNPLDTSEEEMESGLVFLGMAGIIDPPRAESADAIKQAKDAGIKPVMITGDHLLTAKRIAKDVGMFEEGKLAMTGAELNKLSDDELADTIQNVAVFARTAPEDKIRIVQAFQVQGEVVAMTGDGVNDAPALNAADVGVGMGSGTDVAKETSDMVLLDDNFATLVEAVKQGRRVYANIRKSIYAMLGCNFSALSIIMLSMLLGWGAPVTAIQLLLIKVIADGIPGFSLCVEPAEKDIMKHDPIPSYKSIFADGLLGKIIEITIVFTILSMIPAYLELDSANASMTFLVLGFTTIIHIYNCRSRHSLFTIGITTNSLVLKTTIFSTIALALIVITPFLGNIVGLYPINLAKWLVVIAISVMPFVYIELRKRYTSF